MHTYKYINTVAVWCKSQYLMRDVNDNNVYLAA